MKKNLFYFVFAGLFSMGMLTACEKENPVDNGNGTEQPGEGDDNEGDNTVSFPIEEKLAGDYKTKVSVDFAEAITETNNKIIISKSSDDAIKMELKNFSFGPIVIGDLAVDNCKLSKIETENIFSFSGEATLDVVIAEGAPAVPCNVTIKEGSIGNDNLAMKIDVVVPMAGNLSVKVECSGSKMSGNEIAEAEILEFYFDKENPKNAIILEQPKWVEESKAYVFSVNNEILETTPEALKTLVPTIKISEKASCSIKSGEETDFSNDINIIVTAENLENKSFKIKAPAKNYSMKYSFDKWTLAENLGQKFPTPDNSDLSSSNAGAVFFNGEDPKLGYPVLEETNGFTNKAAKLITLYSNNYMDGKAPITSGSLFTGKFEFDIMAALLNPLTMTKFGLPYAKKPVSFKGYYKYTSGDKFINGSKNPAEEIPNKKDQCAIQAVLYTEELDESGNNIPLDGTNINNSDRRVAVAQLEDGSDKSDWTEFNIPFKYLEGKTYEEGKKYYLAVVCSSSKDGDKFQGAINSTLLIDEFEIIGE